MLERAAPSAPALLSDCRPLTFALLPKPMRKALGCMPFGEMLNIER